MGNNWFTRFMAHAGGWWVVAPTLVIIGLMLVLTGGETASATSQPRVLLTNVLFQEQKPLCQSCHPKEYEDWKNTTHAKATLDPAFRDQLAKSSNQAACLACHTTGFDTTSGKFLSEGVTCEACHGPYKEGHPNAATMKLPMESETCHVCHQSTFEEWEGSQHAAKGIECYDCHLAHTQGLRTGSEQSLCASCHSERQTEVAHATHGINGVNCASCHMSGHSMSAAKGMQIEARNHDFQVSSDVCAGCHQATIHTSDTTPKLREAMAVSDPNRLVAQADRVPGLEKQVTDLQSSLAQVRNLGVVSSGLAFGFGGFLGLLGGIVGMTLWQKRG